MNGTNVMSCVDAAYSTIIRHRDEIAQLDQAIGDGDHVFNIIRGLEALQAMREQIQAEEFQKALLTSANRLLSTIGGSSGPLLASLLMGMAKTPAPELNSSSLALMFKAGVALMAARGKAGVGEKTMLDVLIPVSEVLTALTAENTPNPVLLEAIKIQAEQGMLATKDMIATKGRASFLGERAIGHIDPGARSSQLIITAICDLAGREDEKVFEQPRNVFAR
jgi:phosphoenolpyruvate---glycerone phosphotransferase subunit DhaL